MKGHFYAVNIPDTYFETQEKGRIGHLCGNIGSSILFFPKALQDGMAVMMTLKLSSSLWL